MEKFAMSRTLVKRATYRRGEVGDHGDAYENALLTGIIDDELRFVVKEVFDHLRAALDYCAKEICSPYAASNINQKIYFPIVNRNFKKEDFRSLVGKLMPGVITEKPNILLILESFQPFTSPKNNWIADFATLCNENKHEQLSVTEVKSIRGHIWSDEQGQKLISYKKEDGTPFIPTQMMLMYDYPENGVGNFRALYLSFSDMDIEVLGLLDSALAGVRHILDSLASE